MMPLERRNEPQMLQQFSKLYPSYNLNPLLRRLRLLGRRWTRPQRVLVRYDPLSHTVLSYLCEVVQRASERSYLGKRGLKINVRQPLGGGD